MAWRGGSTSWPVARSRASTRSIVLADSMMIPSRRKSMRSFSRPQREYWSRRSCRRRTVAAGRLRFPNMMRPTRPGLQPAQIRGDIPAAPAEQGGAGQPENLGGEAPVAGLLPHGQGLQTGPGYRRQRGRRETNDQSEGTRHATELHRDLSMRPVVANSVSHVSAPLQLWRGAILKKFQRNYRRSRVVDSYYASD